MKRKKLRLYEGMYILSSTLSEEARKKAFEKITNGITEKGGEISKLHDIGKKRLAYEVRGRREGYYYLIYFKLGSLQMKELWEEYPLYEDLLRYLTIKAESVKENLEFKSLKQV